MPSYKLIEPGSDQEARDSSTTGKPCHLLKLPGEMRNRIYEYALISPNKIQVTPTGYNINSGLLGTCKEIRAEAHGIFYADNTFGLHVRNYDSATVMHWLDHLEHLFHRTLKVTSTSTIWDEPCWANLMIWLARYHFGKRIACNGLRQAIFKGRRPFKLDVFMIEGMFETVQKLQAQPWATIMGVLETNRHTLVLIDGRWRF